MANNQIDAINKELHPQAENLARQYIDDFASSLILQAKILAYRRKDDIVLSTHIEEALDAITKERKQNWTKELSIFVGAAFFGAFIQGFVTELNAGRTGLVAIYTIMGFVGMLLAFWGIRR